MVSVPIEFITIGIALLSPVYYGLWVLSKQDSESAINRANMSADIKNLSGRLDDVISHIFDVTNKMNNCKFCNTRKGVVDVVEYSDDQWTFRSK